MKHQVLRFGLFLFWCMAIMPAAFAQQAQLPQSPEARRHVLHALQGVRASLDKHPTLLNTLNAAKFSADDSLDAGGIAGRIAGLTDADSSAWVLAVAAHLYEDPTAWAFGEVKDDGEYFISGLNMGSYLIMAGADGYMPQFFSNAYNIWEAAIVEVAPNEITDGIDFYLEPAQMGSGSITGRVVAEDTGEPLAGAQIYAFSVNNSFVNVRTETNDDGTYELPELRSGSYYVQAYAEGYFNQFYDGVADIENATTVLIVDQEVTENIDFAMNRGGTISGTVTDANGEPLAGASIQVSAINDRGDYYGYYYGWAVSDDAGNYIVSGLGDGDYVVSIYYHGQNFSVNKWYDNAATFEDATPVSVALGEDTSNINFVIESPTAFGSIAGTLSMEDGSPLQNAIVRLESIDTPGFYFFSYAYPDDNGSYVLDDVPVGTYRVVMEYWTNWFYDSIWYEQADNPEDATPVQVAENEQVNDINFVIPVAEGVISGVVTNVEGKPIANAYIQLNNAYRDDGTGSGVYLWAYANTDNNGAFTIEGLPDGEYIISAFFCYFYECAQAWWPAAQYPEEAEPIVIADGISNPPSISFELDIRLGDASISGNVSRNTGEVLEGALVSIAPYVDFNDPDSTGIDPDYPWVSEIQTYTDSEGNYSFNYLPAGTYRLFSSYWEDGASGFAWYENATDIVDATPVDLGETQEVADINFALDVRSYYGTLAGRVVRENDVPIERAYVEVNAYYRNYDLDIAFYPSEWYGITDANGAFEIGQLYEGEYMVSVYAQDAYLAKTDSGEVEISYIQIRGGEITEIDVTMITQQDGDAQIAGQVVNDQGDPLDISIIRAIPVTDDDAPAYTAIANEDGTYRFNNLPEGGYYVRARGPMHITAYFNDTFDPAEAEIVETSNSASAEGIDFSLEPFYYFYDFAEGDALGLPGVSNQASIVYGSVHSQDGTPIAGATVYVVDESGDALMSTETFEDGMYELPGIQPGQEYRIKASHVGYESQFNGEARDVASADGLTMNSGQYEFNFTLSKSNTSVGNDDRPTLPRQLALHGNYPNPFSGATRISFTLPQSTHVSIEVYDTLGRRVANLHDGLLNAGTHDIAWQTSTSSKTLPSGLYFYRVVAGQEQSTGSMTMFR